MTTTVQLSIAGRGEDDAPLLNDLLDQVCDYFEMISGVAASMTEDGGEQYDWRVVGLSKNSPATITVEAVARHGFPDGASLAARAREQTSYGLTRLQRESVRPLHFTDNVLEAADRFARRLTRGLAETRVVTGGNVEVVFRPAEAVAAIDHIAVVREDDPVHPYKELGSVEGVIQSVGADAWGASFYSSPQSAYQRRREVFPSWRRFERAGARTSRQRRVEAATRDRAGRPALSFTWQSFPSRHYPARVLCSDEGSSRPVGSD